MKKSKYYTPNYFWKVIKFNLCLIIVLNLSFLKNSYCNNFFFDDYQYCGNETSNSFRNTKCFNNVLKFRHKKYLSNNFAISNEGDFITEFTEYAKYDELTYSRLFYGFTGDGRQFLSNQSSYTSEMNIDIDENDYDKNEFFYHHGIYNSKNFFVPFPNANKNQYLLSINSYNSMVELHDLSKDNNNYIIWSIKKFFKLDENQYYWPYELEMYKLKNDPSYIIAFIPTFDINEELSELSFLINFQIQSFDENAYKYINSVDFKNYVGSRIINTFLMDEVNINTLVIMAYKKIEIDETTIEEYPYLDYGLIYGYDGPNPYQISNDGRRVESNYIYEFYLNFYNRRLSLIYNIKEMRIYSPYLQNCLINELFIKSLYLNDKSVIFIFFDTDYRVFVIELFNLNYNGNQGENNIFVPYIGKFLYEDTLMISFDFYESESDFVKINNYMVAFIYTGFIYERMVGLRALGKSKLPYNRMICILLIYLDSYDRRIYTYDYYIDFDKYTPTMKISGALYNNYLLISSIVKKKEGNYLHDCSEELLSLFMIFGYPNGTDSTVNISEYFYKENKPNHEFFKLLYKNFKIENNIFGFLPTMWIRLVSVPKEIKISVLLENGTKYHLDEIYGLEEQFIHCILNRYDDYDDYEDYYDYDDYDDCINDYYFIIEPNKDLIKTSQYYYIDYQHIVRDDEDDYYGRVNRLKFKLCHDYCGTCIEFGTSIDKQNCLSCLPEYQYDYLYFSNRTEDYPKNTCVPYGYYYDIEYGELEKCIPSENDYYLNKTDNKTI